MNKKEFTKLFRELQKIQFSLLYSTKFSSNFYTSCNLNNTSYIYIYLFSILIEILMKHIVIIFSNDSIDKNKAIIDKIKQKVKQLTTPLRGNKRSEAERSDALIK